MMRGKIIIIAGIFAMVVSLTSGGLSGVSGRPLFIRALTAGISFVVLAWGISVILSKFFPELLRNRERESMDTDDNLEMGHNVDIVMSDESSSSAESGQEGENFSVEKQSSTEERKEGLQDESNPSAGGNAPLGTLNDALPSYQDTEGEGSDKTRDIPGIDRDPSEIARAVHTVLNRDEEG